jgi:hypothetical protein
MFIELMRDVTVGTILCKIQFDFVAIAIGEFTIVGTLK